MTTKTRIPWWIAGATTLFQLLTAARGGIFRDELYYLACSEHLGLGYVDQPPLVGYIAWLARHLFGESLPGLRFLPALAAGGTVALTAGMARRLGGGRFAVSLAAVLAALAPVYVSLCGILSMNAFDVLLWAAGFFLLLRVLDRQAPRDWLLFGLVAGIGLENKLSMGFLGAGVAAGLLLAREWQHFRRPWLWLGGTLALLLFLPHLVWQGVHGWPAREFMANAMGSKNASLSLSDYMRAWTLQMNPAAVPVVLAGLVFLLVLPAGKPYRALGWASLVILGLLLSQRSKPYYLSPLFTLLFATGSVVASQVTAPRRLGWLRVVLLVACIGVGLALTPRAKPLLPTDTYVAYAARLGLSMPADENHEMGRLPQFFADRIGWRELAETVARVAGTLTPEERQGLCVFGQNYGQAGAIDFYGPSLGLPKALSGHNSYFLWGPRGCRGDVIIVIDDDLESLLEVFESAELATTYTCQDCMPYENNKPIWIARRLKLPLEKLWPEVRHYR